jgi:molecular chaperone HscB
MSPTDHFERLGLARGVDLDTAALEQAYLALAQAHHPDRAVGQDAAARRAAMEASAAINEGYRILRDPVRRAEYLCKLAGIDLDVTDRERGAPHMPPAFLAEMIERREALEGARKQGFAAIDALRSATAAELATCFARASAALRSGEVRSAAVALVERRYLQRLIDEIDEIDEV